MSPRREEIRGVPVLVVPPDGAPPDGEPGALELLGWAYEHDVRWAAVPLARLGPDFLRLETRVAGLMIQKLVHYRLGL